MHQMLRNLSEILELRFPATKLSRLLRGKNCPCQVCFLRNIWTESKSSRRSITAAKRYEKKKKKTGAKKSWCKWAERHVDVLQMPF